MEDEDQIDDIFSSYTASTTGLYDSTPSSLHTPKLFDRYCTSSSSEDEDKSHPSNPSIESTYKRLDCMVQFLDRKLGTSNESDDNDGDGNRRRRRNGSLPEFVGNGGGAGIFKVPVRGAVHPNRPPSLDVRPHPLRESQLGRFLRAMTSTERQLWTGSEDGSVRVWELKDLYGSGGEGDEVDTAPYRESAGVGSSVMCMVGDEGSRVVWIGHRDGRISCWKMRLDRNFAEAFSWQGHRGPVLSIAVSSYGDIWAGSEGGAIKIWPWEAIEKSLSLTLEKGHLAVLSLERSYVDPRGQLAVSGFSSSLTSDVKCLLSDRARAKMWSAGFLSFALWDARTRELLKVFNLDGQVENRVDLSLLPDLAIEDEVKIKTATSVKKDKIQTSLGFFQRSRNVLMGAADAVRRVAVKGGLGDDGRRTEVIVITIDGTIWTGCANGSLVQWDCNGNRLQDFLFQSSGVLSLSTFGYRIWVGYANGIVQVLDLEGNLLGGWIAHSSPVIKMSVWAGYICTMANHGGIRGWNITSPGPLDSVLRTELAEKEFIYTRIENLKLLAGTWNVGEGRASTDSLVSWLGFAASEVGIVVVGLQEVEMGAGVFAMSAAKETVGLDGSSVGQWWLDMIGKTLDEGSSFERIGSRQLAGLLIAVWVRSTLKPHVGDIDAAAVPCGFGRALGNKGAVSLRIRVFDRLLCFVNCHFAAHLEAVNRRNADFDHVYRSMTFSRSSNWFNAAAAGTSSAVSMLRTTNAAGVNSIEGTPELSEADMVIFLGDFNYRLDDISYDEARDFISQRSFDWLREKDQLRAEMEAGNVFQGMREAVIVFPPTYKFERHQVGLAGYDSGEKKRIPAWCDRILYRDSRSSLEAECSLECPVVSSITQYEACMDVTDSDHKPVRCVFNVEIARVDESIRRQEYGDIMGSNPKVKRMLEMLFKIPETIVSTNNILLQNKDTSTLRITNKSEENIALFEIICEGQSTIQEDGQASKSCPLGSFGFPRWLQVTPATGIIGPDEIAEVSVHLEDFPTLEDFVDGVQQNMWCEDTRDKEVVLVVRVLGNYSTETRNHRIRVRHCPAAKAKGVDRNPVGPRQTSASVLPRSDYQQLSNSFDVVNHLRKLHSP